MVVGVGVGVGAEVGEAGADCCHDAPRNREQPDGFRPRTSTKHPPEISWRENFLRGGKKGKYQEWTEADNEQKQIHQPERVIVVKERSCSLVTKAASASHIPGVQPLKVQEDRQNTHLLGVGWRREELELSWRRFPLQ